MKIEIKNYNKLIALLILVFNIFIVYNFFLINLELKKMEYGVPEEKIIGMAVQSVVSLCFDRGIPRINLFYPLGGDILNLTVNISTNISNPLGIINYTLTFYYLISSTTEIDKDEYDGDYNFNVSWDTTLVDDDNCNYKVRVTGQSNVTFCSPFDDKTSGFFTIDNVLVEPIWSDFNNSVTTNFSLFSRWSNLSDVIIGNTYGLINFSGSGWNFDSVNIDNEIKIGNNSINFTLTSSCFSSFSLHLSMFNVSIINPVLLRNGQTCPGSICSSINLNNGTLTFIVNSFGNYLAGVTDLSSNLEIWDETDGKGGDLTRRANEDLVFFANYTKEDNGPINGNDIFCEIKFNITQFTAPVNMSFNSSSNVYQYSRNFNSRGNYTWNVFCDGSAQLYIMQNITDKVIITNTPPNLTANISNLEWNEDVVLTGLNLNHYFSDVDDDNLSFSYSPVNNILIVIDSKKIVSFIPDANWFGLRRVVFTANDSINTTDSNNITLVINDVAETTPTPSAGAAGGGGGGGGATYTCIDEWYCIPWGVCQEGFRSRDCYDLNNCNTFKNKPNETEACVFIAECYDGIQNNGETGVDCGGPCPACFTCYDRQLNHDETDIDCGGKICNPCSGGKNCLVNSDCESDYCNPDKICSIPSCSDGWQNQGEGGIDCDGPCPNKCPIIAQPTLISRTFDRILSPILLILLIIILLLALLINTARYPISRRILIFFYKLSKSKRRIPQERMDYVAKYTIDRLRQLEKRLTARNTQYIFNELILVFRKFLENLLQLNPDFTAEQLNQKLSAMHLNSTVKKHLSGYHNNLLRYRDLKLTKKDVHMFIGYAKDLVSFILNNHK